MFTTVNTTGPLQVSDLDKMSAAGEPPTVENEVGANQSLAYLVHRASRIFNGQDQSIAPQRFLGPVNRIEIEGKVFYGIHRDDQKLLDSKEWANLLVQVKIDMGLDPKTETVQVVGDSQVYDAIGTEYNRSFLKSNISRDSMILWGFTGRSWDGGRYADVNGIVNDLIDADPGHWQNRCLANVVSFHTPAAIGGIDGGKGWGKDASHPIDGSHHVKHFWLVFDNENASPVCFGDDVLSSDNFSQSLLCLEGGLQALNQFMRCLSLGQPVKVSYNTRGLFHEPSWMSTYSGNPLFKNEEGKVYFVEKDPGEDVVSGTIHYIQGYSDDGFSDKVVLSDSVSDVHDVSQMEQRWYADFFSVGGLVAFMKEKLTGKKNPLKEELISCWNEYSKTHLPTNPKAADFSTKSALLADAREMFLQVANQFNRVKLGVCMRDIAATMVDEPYSR
jgi:hypothetical protein